MVDSVVEDNNETINDNDKPSRPSLEEEDRKQENRDEEEGSKAAASTTMTKTTEKLSPKKKNTATTTSNKDQPAVAVSPENDTSSTTGNSENQNGEADTEEETDPSSTASSKNKKRIDVGGEAAAAPILPSRPVKRARTAYFIFMEAKRPEVLSKHPGEGVAAQARLLGQLWNTLAPEEKEVYQKKAADERERVSREMEEWKAAGGTMEDNKDEAQSSKTTTARDSIALIFPVARIRKITKLDPEVRGISKEALLLITKCAELATAKLGKESVHVAQLQNRRKLLPEDVAQVCGTREQFLFLRDDVKDLVKEQKENNKTTTNEGGSSLGVPANAKTTAAAAGTKPLTSYFSSK